MRKFPLPATILVLCTVGFLAASIVVLWCDNAAKSEVDRQLVNKQASFVLPNGWIKERGKNGALPASGFLVFSRPSSGVSSARAYAIYHPYTQAQEFGGAAYLSLAISDDLDDLRSKDAVELFAAFGSDADDRTPVYVQFNHVISAYAAKHVGPGKHGVYIVRGEWSEPFDSAVRPEFEALTRSLAIN